MVLVGYTYDLELTFFIKCLVVDCLLFQHYELHTSSILKTDAW